jgi:hypothetical protein
MKTITIRPAHPFFGYYRGVIYSDHEGQKVIDLIPPRSTSKNKRQVKQKTIPYFHYVAQCFIYKSCGYILSPDDLIFIKNGDIADHRPGNLIGLRHYRNALKSSTPYLSHSPDVLVTYDLEDTGSFTYNEKLANLSILPDTLKCNRGLLIPVLAENYL